MCLDVFQIEAGVTSSGKWNWEFHEAVYFPLSKDPSREQALTLDKNHHSLRGAGSGVSFRCVKIMTITSKGQPPGLKNQADAQVP